MILLTATVLFALHAGSLLLAPIPAAPSAAYDARAMPGTALALHASSDDQLDGTDVTRPAARLIPVSVVPAAMKLDVAVRPHLVDLRSSVVARRPGDGVRGTGSAGFGLAYARPQTGSPDDPLGLVASDSRLIVAAGSLPLAILVFAFVGIWHVQRPLRNVTRTARESASGRLSVAMREEGPGELRQLIRAFNDMIHRRNEAIEVQSAALAGLARHMELRTARLRARALGVVEWHKRVAFVEDIDSFSTIAQQLLDVAGRCNAAEPDVPVDDFLRDRFAMTSVMDRSLFVLDLKAGPRFMLSRTLLERLMANLVDNALAHGAPPIEISTSRTHREWTLSVRDHGEGISEHELASATRPFVRLGADRGSGHWGLGLAVVARLARSCGALLKLGNHPDGGLRVQIVVPASY